jgi:hypothetical protein
MGNNCGEYLMGKGQFILDEQPSINGDVDVDPLAPTV